MRGKNENNLTICWRGDPSRLDFGFHLTDFQRNAGERCVGERQLRVTRGQCGTALSNLLLDIEDGVPGGLAGIDCQRVACHQTFGPFSLTFQQCQLCLQKGE